MILLGIRDSGIWPGVWYYLGGRREKQTLGAAFLGGGTMRSTIGEGGVPRVRPLGVASRAGDRSASNALAPH